MPQESAPTPSKEKLSFVENFGFGLGDVASNLVWATMNMFIVYYYNVVLKIDAGTIFVIMIVVRSIDAVTDPVMGIIADRTKTKWGKYRPYLLWMAIPYGICGYLMFAVPDWDYWGKIMYVCATYLMMMLAYTAINVPYSSLMGVISQHSQARRVAADFRFFGAFGGGLLIALFVRPLAEIIGGEDVVSGYRYTMAIFAALSVVLFLVCFATTKERVAPPKSQKQNVREEIGELVKNRPWIILFYAAIASAAFLALRDAATAHYFEFVLKVGDDKVFWILDKTSLFFSSGKFSMMVGVLCAGLFLKKADKRPLAAWFAAGTGVCILSFYFIPADMYMTMVVVNCIGSFMFGPTAAIVWSMYGDVADYGEYKFKRRSTGLIHSASLFSLKTGFLLAGAGATLMLKLFGFDEQITAQSTTAIFGITLMFTVIPGVVALLKAFFLWRYPLDAKAIAMIEDELEERKKAS